MANLGVRLHNSNLYFDIKASSLGHTLKKKVIGKFCIFLQCVLNCFSIFVSAFAPTPPFFFLFYTSHRRLSIQGLAYMEENTGQNFLESLWDAATEWSTAGSNKCSSVLNSVVPFKSCRPETLHQSEATASQSGLLCFDIFCCTTSGLSHPGSFHYTSPSGFFYERAFEVHLIKRWQ